MRDVATFNTSMPEWPRIEGYVLEALIGRGGMGRVFRARDVELGRMVAVKFLLHTDDEQVWRRFADEARAIAKLQHPNIARLFEFHADQRQPYLVMEYIGGGTLAELVGSRPIGAKLACRIVSTLAHAIESAHQQGIVHRDLKPGNVLIAPSGAATAVGSAVRPQPETQDSTVPNARGPLVAAPAAELDADFDASCLRIADFGLAKQVAADTKHTRTGEIVGTPDYMSPEQATGVVKQIGPSTDIYALGAILYKLITGRPPFVGVDTVDTILMLLSDEPVPPRTLVPQLPVDVQTICLKCLDKNPARRYGSARELAEDLDRFVRGEPILARPISLVERVVKWSRRKPWQAIAAALLTVSAIGAAVGLLLLQAAYRDVRTANGNLNQANKDLRKAVREADLAFNLSQDSLGRIVDRIRNDLYEVPQAEQLNRETARDSADLHRRLWALRPHDTRTLHQFVTSLDIHRLTEWTYGNREEAQELTSELMKLVDDASRRRADDVFVLTKQTNLWMEVADQLDAKTNAAERAEYDQKIQNQLTRLLKHHPNDPQVCKTASLQAQRLVNEAVQKGDLPLTIERTEQRVEYSRRFARHATDADRNAAVQWLVQSLVTLSEFQLAARNFEQVNELLDEAEQTLLTGNSLSNANRGERGLVAHIQAIRGKASAMQQQLEAASESLRTSEELYQRILADFPDDLSVALPLAGVQVDLASVLLAQEHQDEALRKLDAASGLAKAVLAKLPGDYLATSIQERIAHLRARIGGQP